MSDTTDNLIITASINDPGFQSRCRLRFINASIAITTEVLSVTTNGSSGSGVSILHMSGTVGIVGGMTVTSLFSPTAIPTGTVVESIAAGTVTLNNNLIGGGIITGDTISFAPTGHASKLAFSSALFANNVDLKMLAMLILANTTNRNNCLANPGIYGGNILDNDMDFQINSVFPGVAASRNWS